MTNPTGSRSDLKFVVPSDNSHFSSFLLLSSSIDKTDTPAAVSLPGARPPKCCSTMLLLESWLENDNGSSVLLTPGVLRIALSRDTWPPKPLSETSVTRSSFELLACMLSFSLLVAGERAVSIWLCSLFCKLRVSMSVKFSLPTFMSLPRVCDMERLGLGAGLAVRMLLLSELFIDMEELCPTCPRSRARGRDREADKLPAARARNVPPLLM
mmetsp:Transcript_70262/g.114137  ORF Transcript_70262/g.114137 Transcript_70262/m.114137 type:complete len:212 (+) Transcript_70262:772-1407(+)